MTDHRPTIGVMGGAAAGLKEGELSKAQDLIERLSKAIAARKCVLITGETTGVPGQVIESAARAGALTVGISPAHSYEEHSERYGMPAHGSNVVIYTGFGLKGRNVINIRSSDIVIIFGGSIGTLNEFTVAYDEGKIIGILEGTGGVADLIPGIVLTLAKPTKSQFVYEKDPQVLIDKCLSLLAKRESGDKKILSDSEI